MTNSYQIWTEGFATDGQFGRARYCGVYKGATFAEAVAALAKEKGWTEGELFSSERPTYKGCRFFDNEKEARKYFG